MKKIAFGISLILILSAGLEARAASVGDVRSFSIDQGYDSNARPTTQAVLTYSAQNLYFYIDNNWWNGLDSSARQSIGSSINSLAEEFTNKIYPTLTQAFGSEWNPGIDKDEKITILIHPMKEDVGGYFNSADEYPKAQIPLSNEREMIYLNSNFIDKPQVKYFLGHEFVHLITFYQKEKIYGVSEEVWLNEARAEYGSTLLGYDNIYEGSNLQRRIRNFLDKPTDSITEWQGKSYDYGVLNIFTQYLVDQYGKEVLTESLRLRKTGIESLNETLSKKGFVDSFSQIFTNWTVAVLVNNCDFGPRYCYKNPNLINFRITATPNFLPMSGESMLSVTSSEKQWSGNWQKFVGGRGDLTLQFKGISGASFKIPYIVEDTLGNYTISFLQLDSNKNGTITVPKLGIKNISLIIIPTISSKISNFSSEEESFSFSWQATTRDESVPDETEIMNKLLLKIEELKKEIAIVQAQLSSRNGGNGEFSCGKFQTNLYFGIRQNQEVRCLQEFLKSQGGGIYPDGLVTGNFLNATKSAVVRFQEKYASEILFPVGLQAGNGYVGSKTREKINSILGR